LGRQRVKRGISKETGHQHEDTETTMNTRISGLGVLAEPIRECWFHRWTRKCHSSEDLFPFLHKILHQKFSLSPISYNVKKQIKIP
jgi:hypothetical protein